MIKMGEEDFLSFFSLIRLSGFLESLRNYSFILIIISEDCIVEVFSKLFKDNLNSIAIS